MAPTIPTKEPTVFAIGTSWDWDKSLGTYPAGDGWQLTYYLRALEAASSDITLAWAAEVTASGDTFQVRTPPATSTAAGLTPGAYELVGEVTDGTDTYIVTRLRVRVLAAASASGGQSHAAFMLTTIQDRQQSRVLTSEQRRVQINGRSIEYATDSELEAARAHWAYVVQLERNPNARIVSAARFVRG